MSAEWRNAVIRRATLGFEDHGLLSSFVDLNYGSSGQGFGGFALGGDYASRWIAGVLRVAEVDDWSKLPGRPVRALADFGKVHAIRHILDDRIEFRPWEVEPSR